MNDEWKSLLKTVAPVLGTALGGPFGGVAASFIAGKLGLDNKTVEAVTTALTGNAVTPENIVQLRAAEDDMKKFMAEHDIKLAQLDNENVAGARHMKEVTGSQFPEALSAVITIGFFGVLAYMMHDHTAMESQPLLIMLGTLGAAQTAVLNFWLGSNKGSDRTKELLAQATLK